ncbi:hypothetical protein SCP_0114070 [Sparassis crispa]|uniref:Uncharacterized protein n=1 Tax=Sparassis crispa TaxID=139825 RepID=A0A401G8N7_9APHY|nr:hypothetical protein SCP_0114070 [Sparassis crispa]GBE78518.1 hypothetical protein SCP_0114070 [Sparassis crispa]
MAPLAHTEPIILRLPIELLLLIRSFIPLHSAKTHIAFQSSCGAIRAIYQDDERFWAKVCLASGVGHPRYQPEHPLQNAPWRELAIATTNHRLKCPFPPCRDNFHLGTDDVSGPVLSPTVVQRDKIACEGFLTWFEFDMEYFELNRIYNCEASNTRGGPVTNFYEDHNVLACTFATNPPLLLINIDILGIDTVAVTNPGGVTVGDVFKIMYDAFISTPSFTLSEFVSLYRTNRELFTCFIKFDWLETTTLQKVLDHARLLESQGEITDPQMLQYMETIEAAFGGFAQNVAVADVWQLLHTGTWTIERLIKRFAEMIPCVRKESWFTDLEMHQDMTDIVQHLQFCGLKQTAPGSVKFVAQWQYDGDEEDD